MGGQRAAVGMLYCALAGCAGVPPDLGLVDDEPESVLFVADRAGDAILRYSGPDGAFIDVFASEVSERVDRPSSVRLGPSGHLYLAGFGRGDVVRYDIVTGALVDVFYADSTVLEEPVELLFHGDQLLVLGNDSENAVVIDADGIALRSFGPMRAAHDFAIGPDGMLYVAIDRGRALVHAIQVWDIALGRRVRTFAALDEVDQAGGVTFGPDGLLYVVDPNRDRVSRFEPTSGALLDVVVDDAALESPISLDFTPGGSLAVVDQRGVHRFDPTTGESLGTLVAVADGHLVRPRSITFETAEALTAAANRIRR